MYIILYNYLILVVQLSYLGAPIRAFKVWQDSEAAELETKRLHRAIAKWRNGNPTERSGESARFTDIQGLNKVGKTDVF